MRLTLNVNASKADISEFSSKFLLNCDDLP